MADINGLITLKSLVEELIFKQKKDKSYYKRYMQFAIDGMRDFSLFQSKAITTKKLTMNNLGIITFPTDYLSFLSLSMPYGGKMWTLTRRDDMVSTTTIENGQEVYDSDMGEGVALSTGYDRGMATTGGKNDYYYTILDNRRIMVRNTPVRTLFLEYISSGVDLEAGNQTYIPVIAKAIIQRYIMKEDVLFNDKADKRLIEIYRRDYNIEVAKYKALTRMTVDELKDLFYSTMSYGVKR